MNPIPSIPGYITEPEPPVRDGYTFDGWYKEAAGTNKWNFATGIAFRDTTLYANWSVIPGVAFALYFDANGGETISPDSKTVTTSEVVGTLPVSTRSGYTFAGWNTTQNGSGTAYTAETKYLVAGNSTLYAQWEKTTGYADELQITTNLYPNPFAGMLHLTGAEGCNLQVITTNGAVVHTQKVVNPDEIISLEKLPAGLYFFRLEKAGKVKTLKAVKQ